MHVTEPTARRLIKLALLAIVAFLPKPAAGELQGKSDVNSCEVRIEGQHVISIKLTSKQGSQLVREAQGGVIYLPPGRYRIENILLDGELGHFRDPNLKDRWFVVSAGKPHRLKAGAPLSPTIKATRKGPCLQFDYELVDAEGRTYANPTKRLTPPTFTVFLGDRQIGSGSFEYG